MIAIVNQMKKNEEGETQYNCYCNKDLLFTFYHKREEGLAKCLERASEQAKIMENNSKRTLLAFVEVMCGGSELL